MSVLVIHPKDPTTDFLQEIYVDKNWTVIHYNPSTKYLKHCLKTHDQIIMLGHGTPDGLIGFNRLVINSTLVYLLRQKQCLFIWCHANEFVKKYKLQGFCTGMIISEYDEAISYLNTAFQQKDIDDSNTMFSQSIKQAIENSFDLKDLDKLYHSNENPVILFNQNNLVFVK